MPGSIHSHYFIIGDGHQPKSVGVYIPIIRIPGFPIVQVGFFPSPIKRDFRPWHICVFFLGGHRH